MGILERESVPKEARKCSAAQGPHSEVVPHALWRHVKSCDEYKGSFARGCEAKRWSHWTCSSLQTIFQPMRINSLPDVKCFCNNKNVLHVQSMVWHLVRHPVFLKLNLSLLWYFVLFLPCIEILIPHENILYNDNVLYTWRWLNNLTLWPLATHIGVVPHR